MTASQDVQATHPARVRWLNTPCTDPIGRVFTTEGRVFRAIFPGEEARARAILDKGEFAALMDAGLIARMHVSDLEVAGSRLVIETERAPFDIPCGRFTRATLRAATLRWLDIYARLLPAGFVLSDAHYGNFMLFGANEPRWVDLGSIRPPSFVTEERPFRSFRRFWSGMLAPLALLETRPQHARLARLSIADQPDQGPLTTSDEPPLAVDALLEDMGSRLLADIGQLDAGGALERLRAFTMQLPHGDASTSSPDKTPATGIVEGIGRHLRAIGATSIICLGTAAFRHLPAPLRGTSVLVIDENEDRLDHLGQTLERGNDGSEVTLYYGHPVNRLFLRNPPTADAVLAIDPLGRYAHHAHAESGNLAHILDVLGGRTAIVIAAARTKERTEHMLRQSYASVSTETFSWFGGGPTLVVGRR